MSALTPASEVMLRHSDEFIELPQLLTARFGPIRGCGQTTLSNTTTGQLLNRTWR